MSQKRFTEAVGFDAHRPTTKRSKRGIQVGPSHLPDGTYKRHVQKIKSRLIDKAKTRKQYGKLKARLQGSDAAVTSPAYLPVGINCDDKRPIDSSLQGLTGRGTEDDNSRVRDRSLGNGPDLPRNNIETNSVDDADGTLALSEANAEDMSFRQKQLNKRARRRNPFEKDARRALNERRVREERRKAREDAAREREVKLHERERFRSAMAKARSGGRDGQRKLGRESSVLLQRIQHTMRK